MRGVECIVFSVVFYGRRQGFTLIELLVVVAILLMLTTIGIVAGRIVNEQAKVSRTRAILDALENIAAGYEIKTDIPIEHVPKSPFHSKWLSDDLMFNAVGKRGTGEIAVDTIGDLYEWPDEVHPLRSDPSQDRTPPYSSHRRANVFIERFCWAAYQVPTLRNSMEAIGGFGDYDGDGFVDYVDAWGNPIVYAYGVIHGRTDGSYPEDDFLPEHTRPYFASAGPDGYWGRYLDAEELSSGVSAYDEYESFSDFDDYIDSYEYAYIEDNIYSFDDEQNSRPGER